ncbi:unnamed protein product [Ceutorhynchus assimilis]|uniref:Regulatory protein zeste n=1 Tax=Ceutorhynchus assimilis TaxID=467358 RepID=A0A9N9QJN3_9CUCU|nr:unnamed protein product [Ceutorhynchus assimilis]
MISISDNKVPVKRVPNFSVAEKTHLMRLIASKYVSVLEDKKTDRTSSIQKNKAWQLIENEFNSSSSSGVYRNAACLQKCYSNKQKELRKSLAEERKEILLTGGGPPPKIKKDESDQILESIMNKKTLLGFTCQFDDDADISPIIKLGKQENVIEFVIEEDGVLEPTVSLEKTAIITETLSSNYDHVAIKQIRQASQVELNNLKKKNSCCKKIHRLMAVKKIPGKNIPQYNYKLLSASSTSLTPKNRPSRRRPTTIIKPMISSDVGKKYDLLLDRRLQLIDCQLKHTEAENALVMKKHKLEIEILEIELANKKQQRFKTTFQNNDF